MKKIILLASLIIPFLSMAQQVDMSQGIRFEEGLTWKQIKAKAKAENKYIFVDCFTTWCGPCKAMDANTYPAKEVGNAVNTKFISVKVQMDQTKFDDSSVIKWYADAKSMAMDYVINAYPCFMFFSPEGQPLHKLVGYKKPADFVAAIQDVFDPGKQFYTRLKNYVPGQMDTAGMKGLIRVLKGQDKSLAGKMAADYLSRIPVASFIEKDNRSLMYEFRANASVLKITIDYIKHWDNNELSIKGNREFMSWFSNQPVLHSKAAIYIEKLSEKDLYDKDNLLFITSFTTTTQDRGFDLLYLHGDQVDKVLGKTNNFSQRLADQVIYNSEVKAQIPKVEDYPVKKPDFHIIEEQLSKKFSQACADRVVLNAKVFWYGEMKEKDNKYWTEYLSYKIDQIERGGLADTTSDIMHLMLINNSAWDIFLHSNDIQQLQHGMKWMEPLVKSHSTLGNICRDTYANILYKAGMKEEAIAWEQKAVEQSPTSKDMRKNLEKMKRGEPTWDQ